MAKKFNLAELMGEAVSKSDTGEMQVEQIPLAEIEENENNSYAQTGIDELAESIKVIGLQQPLVVRRKTEVGYLLLAGHRRRNAAWKSRCPWPWQRAGKPPRWQNRPRHPPAGPGRPPASRADTG